MRVAIHQPNFVPWRPFFEKMAAVDKFVLLTQCQFNREHYQHRFKYKDKWYTMGVSDVRHPTVINQRYYANPQEDWDKIKRRLPQHAAWFSQFDDCIKPMLWTTNIRIISKITGLLGIKTELICDPITQLTGTDRLVEICRILRATTYLAGPSGASYMELDKFKAAGIEVEFQSASRDTRHVFET